MITPSPISKLLHRECYADNIYTDNEINSHLITGSMSQIVAFAGSEDTASLLDVLRVLTRAVSEGSVAVNTHLQR